MYELTPKLTASLDLLHAWGRHDADDYDTTDSGFVAALTYGHLDERQKARMKPGYAITTSRRRPSSTIPWTATRPSSAVWAFAAGAPASITSSSPAWPGPSKAFPEEPSRHGLDRSLPGNGHRHEPDGLLLTDRRVTFIGGFNCQADQAFVARLAEHIADVEADRPLADLQFISDFLIRQVLTDQAEDIQLPVRQADMAGPKGHFFPYIREQVLPDRVRSRQSMKSRAALSL